MVEIGGKTPGGMPGDATEFFQEGVRIPPVKIVEKGEDREDIWNIILANVRTPKSCYGDLKALIGALRIGKTRVKQLIEKHGLRKFRKAKEELKDYAERRIREELKIIPVGIYEYDDIIADDDGIEDNPVRIKVKIEVENNRNLVFDYSGSDKQTKGPVNCTFGVTASATWNALLHITDPTIPGNHGRLRPVKIIIPPGTVLNAVWPAATGGGNCEIHEHIIDSIFGALSDVIPEIVPAYDGGTSACPNLLGGIHPETHENYTFCHAEACGWGGNSWAAGWNTTCVPNGNCNVIPLEILESRFPIIHDEFCLYENSGGAGQFRGGLGYIRTWKLLADNAIFSAFTERVKIKPKGIQGGKEGTNSAILIKTPKDKGFKTFVEKYGVKCPGKFSGIQLKKGDKVKLITGGGGGWGNPLKRNRNLVFQDLSEGFITKTSALHNYGVKIKKEKKDG
jgi:N-methylhydantoinase B/oxoprolinase/acetone carboxylase alpha subunit